MPPKGARSTKLSPSRRSSVRASAKSCTRSPDKGPRWVIRAAFAVLILAVAYIAWLDLSVRAVFEDHEWDVPARIYARSLTVAAGAQVSPRRLDAELRHLRYREVRDTVQRPGEFYRRGSEFGVFVRSFAYWDGVRPARRLKIIFAEDHVAALSSDGKDVDEWPMEPAVIARIHSGRAEDRIPVRLQDVPRNLVLALLAVEDRGFAEHLGVSLRGLARATVANLKAGRAVQGGSTLTQQLAKNFFLDGSRSFSRKVNEALIALLLEVRYSKSQILEAYLNEIYLGQDGRRAVHGFGLAARFYFGRHLKELRVHEIALLVGMVRGASYYDPRRHPGRALQRRDRVIEMMVDAGVLQLKRAKAITRSPLGVLARPPGSNYAYPAFIQQVKNELSKHLRHTENESRPLGVYTTLDPFVQSAAEQALAGQVAALTRRDGKRYAGTQGSVVAINPASGEILSLVGDKNPRAAGFNRALHARRPIGSLVKPAVFLTALRSGRGYGETTYLMDAKVRLTGEDGRTWRPRNYDGKVHGRVPFVDALAHSYNLATVQLGLDVGLGNVISTLRRLGVESRINPYPSVLLGALSLAPVDVARMYQPLAAQGRRAKVHAVKAVMLGERRIFLHRARPERIMPEKDIFVLRGMLEQVIERGTAKWARSQFRPEVRFAGKTGTTDEMRDSWFAGFGRDHLAVVWLGRDDNKPVRLSGSAGALRVWADLMNGIDAAGLPRAAAEKSLRWAGAGSGGKSEAANQCDQGGSRAEGLANAFGYLNCDWRQWLFGDDPPTDRAG